MVTFKGEMFSLSTSYCNVKGFLETSVLTVQWEEAAGADSFSGVLWRSKKAVHSQTCFLSGGRISVSSFAPGWALWLLWPTEHGRSGTCLRDWYLHFLSWEHWFVHVTLSHLWQSCRRDHRRRLWDHLQGKGPWLSPPFQLSPPRHQVHEGSCHELFASFQMNTAECPCSMLYGTEESPSWPSS